jgi:hypothetical protein
VTPNAGSESCPNEANVARRGTSTSPGSEVLLLSVADNADVVRAEADLALAERREKNGAAHLLPGWQPEFELDVVRIAERDESSDR